MDIYDRIAIIEWLASKKDDHMSTFANAWKTHQAVFIKTEKEIVKHTIMIADRLMPCSTKQIAAIATSIQNLIKAGMNTEDIPECVTAFTSLAKE